MTVTSDASPQTRPDPEVSPATTPTRRPSGFGALLLRLHFYTGLFVAPFLLAAALTGLAYTFTPQLDQIVYGDQLTVAQAGGTVRPLSEQVAAASRAHPDGALTSVAPGDGDATTRVVFALPELGEKQHTVFVDPYTAEVRGTLTTSFGSTPLTTWLADLHSDLHLGVVGRHYSEMAASWLWVLALGGVALWWRRQRGARNRARQLMVPDLKAKPGVRRTRSWHAVTGLWLAVGLLLLSATGLTWSRYAGENFSLGLDALSARRPPLSTAGAAPAGGEHHDGGPTDPSPTTDPAVVDDVLQVARTAGLTGPLEIAYPKDAGRAWAVAQVDNTWPVHKDRLAVDATGTTVTARSDFADWPVLAQLSSLGIQVHMGLLFGLVNQILLAVLAIGLICVIVWGYYMWWQRRPVRADRRAGFGAPPAARGAWQQLPTWAMAIGIPVVFAVGWALPLLGIPLLCFLIIDALIGVARRRRSAAPDRPATDAA